MHDWKKRKPVRFDEQPVGRAASLKTRGKVDNGLRSQIERGDRVLSEVYALFGRTPLD